MTSFDSVMGDAVFPSHLFSFRPSVDPEAIVRAVDCQRVSDPIGRIATNAGGWQSQLIEGNSGDPLLDRLAEEIGEFASFLAQNIGSSLSCVDKDWWMNVNPPGDYNVIHHHGKTDLIAVYYPRCTSESGEFRAIRTDGFIYNSLCTDLPSLSSISLPLEEGRAYVLSGHLLHYVLPNREKTDRYSLSYNLHLGNG
jgi:hypothetical protein